MVVVDLNCKNCGKELIRNGKLSASFTKLFEIGQIDTYFCGSCLDDIYVQHEGQLYSKDEWRRKRERLQKAKQRVV